jgi:Tfp pilus assembly protein PilF
LGAGEADKGIEQLRAAVAARPEYVDAWFELASVLKEQGDADGAIEALRHSVTLDDKDAGAFNTLGLLLKRKGDEAGAKEAFARAAALRQAENEEKQNKLKRGAASLNPAKSQ